MRKHLLKNQASEKVWEGQKEILKSKFKITGGNLSSSKVTIKHHHLLSQAEKAMMAEDLSKWEKVFVEAPLSNQVSKPKSPPISYCWVVFAFNYTSLFLLYRFLVFYRAHRIHVNTGGVYSIFLGKGELLFTPPETPIRSFGKG